MNITEVRVTLRDDAKLKAFASIVIDQAFVVRGLKIIEGKNGLFVAMPSRKRKDGDYQDMVHPVNAEARRQLETVVLDEYRRLVAQSPLGPDAVIDYGAV